MVRGHFASIHYHRRMLEDSARMDAYQAAVEALVSPGSVVLDVGAGSGILSLLAARAGARRVYAVESAPIAHLIQPLAFANGLADRVEVIHADAATLTHLPEPPDLLLTECMGTFALSDGMFDALAACRALLAPGGRCCPARIDLYLAPAVASALLPALDWSEPVAGFDMSLAWRSAMQDLFVVNLPAGVTRAPAQRVLSVEVGRPAPPLDATLRWEAPEGLALDALLGWFDAHLSPEVTLHTGPGHTTHWGQALFPFEPVVVPPGGALEVHLRATPLPDRGHPLYAWSGAVLDPDGQVIDRFDHDQARRFDPALFR